MAPLHEYMSSHLNIDNLITHAITDGISPCARLLVSKNDRILFQKDYGFASLVPQKTPLTDKHLFDIASLTKPLCTATLFMLATQEEKIDLEETLGHFFPATKLKNITIKQLLNHTSGLPAWKPYFEKLLTQAPGWAEAKDEHGKKWLLDQILIEKPEAPPGTHTVYSDLGYILLGKILEIIFGKNLNEIFCERVTKPLGLVSTFFNPINMVREPHHVQSQGHPEPVPHTGPRYAVVEGRHSHAFVSTENCPWRGHVLCGEVEDDHASIMGGVAGHAGLFSTATDIWKWLRELAKAKTDTSSFIHKKTFDEFCTIHDKKDLSIPFFTLGFDTPSHPSSTGTHFSPQSLGHLGYTGCSFWWDLEKDATVILLTNRVHPSRDNDQIKAFRPQLHDLIWEEFIK